MTSTGTYSSGLKRTANMVRTGHGSDIAVDDGRNSTYASCFCWINAQGIGSSL